MRQVSELIPVIVQDVKTNAVSSNFFHIGIMMFGLFETVDIFRTRQK